jgi:hypothetical protein
MATAVAVLAVSLIVAPRPTVNAHNHLRQKRLERIEPYRGWTALGGQSRYAIPAEIVECESRGEVHEQSHPYSSSGLYQIEASTWVAYGGRVFAALPYLASKFQQSVIARRIWRSVGAGAWTCAYLTGWL